MSSETTITENVLEHAQDNDWSDRLLTGGAAMLSAMLTRRAVVGSWRGVTNENPPRNPEAPGVTWSKALTYGVLVGALTGAARVISRKALASNTETKPV